MVIKGQSIDRFFLKLRDELKVFFNFNLSNRLHDDKFLKWLAYLGDDFSSPEWSESRIRGNLHNYIQCAGQNWGHD